MKNGKTEVPVKQGYTHIIDLPKPIVTQIDIFDDMCGKHTKKESWRSW